MSCHVTFFQSCLKKHHPKTMVLFFLATWKVQTSNFIRNLPHLLALPTLPGEDITYVVRTHMAASPSLEVSPGKGVGPSPWVEAWKKSSTQRMVVYWWYIIYGRKSLPGAQLVFFPQDFFSKINSIYYTPWTLYI